MTTDTTERGLERLICTALTGHPCDSSSEGGVSEHPATYGAGWVGGNPRDYNREYCVDPAQLSFFLRVTQPEIFESFDPIRDSPAQRKFLARLQGEINRRGTIDVLRKGLKHGPHHIDLFYGTPTPGNEKARILYDQNRFSVTRQLRYSRDETHLALDLGLFLNGLPVVTFELKNSLTKQSVEDAVQQYKRDRDPRETLFGFGRGVAHFAVDDQEVRFCTHLQGNNSWFLPFNQGWNNGTGNPPNPNGLKTDYLWKRILTREGLSDILENYAQIIETRDEKSGSKRRVQIWPRFHQLDVVRRLLSHAQANGVGHRYLIQHSAGSGKSNSIAWLAHQLIVLKQTSQPLFDSIIVVTDRRVLDKQIRDTIRQFAQVSSVVGHAERSGDLRQFIKSGKKIIISTVQKFPFILDEIGDEHRERSFAIIIDEAHSSQGGQTTTKMNIALSTEGSGQEEEETVEDRINRLMQARKMLENASYFAFTATPKNKTLEIFGRPLPAGDRVRHVPFHGYTMKQAIQEGFILDVLQHYTPVESYYRLMKTVAEDPQFDARKARKKLRRYVESHDHAIRQKTEIMIDHFHEKVIAHRKIRGLARAMVVTGSVERAIRYFHAFQTYLRERKSAFQAIVAFSGEHEDGGRQVSESSLNRFPGSRIAELIREEPYRFLIVAEKFQTGYDEPLLHTMYVDKILSGVKAVQTLSRLNRAHPHKHDCFVLDFINDVEVIRASFEPYYRTTILSEETDPNKLHDLQGALDGYQVYDQEQVETLVTLYAQGADRDQLDPILDACVAIYQSDLDEDGQVDFKSKAKAFTRTYGFLASILPYVNMEWEKLTIFLNFLTPRLPAPEEQDFSLGILQAIDMDSYRAEVQASMAIALSDTDATVDPLPTGEGGRKPETELDHLSNILETFNERFGDIEWKDADKIIQIIAEELPVKVAADPSYRNAMRNSDKQNARIEHDSALRRAVLDLLSDQTELYKQFSDNPSFRKWLSETIFTRTYHQGDGDTISTRL